MASSISASKAAGRPRLMRHRTLAAPTGSAHPVADRVLPRPEFPNTAIDRAARQTGGRRRGCHTAKAQRQRLVRGKQSPAALIKERGASLVAATDVVDINHAAKASVPAPRRT